MKKFFMNGEVQKCYILGADVPVYSDSATVLAVQKALKARGFDPGKLDGVMGENTGKAITAFQFASNLPPTGVIDPAVLVSLAIPPPAKSKAKDQALVPVSPVEEKPSFFMQMVPVPVVGETELWKVLLGVKGILLVVTGVAWLAMRKRK